MKAIKIAEKLERENKIVVGKEYNPKEFSKVLTPLNIAFYTDVKDTAVDFKKEVFKFVDERDDLEILSEKELSLKELNKLTKANWETLYSSASLINDRILEVETIYGFVRPIYFPKWDSNIGIYTNKNNESSYVIDGRAVVIGDKLFNISSNQRAVEKFIASRTNNEEENRTSLRKVFSSELFPVEDERGNIAEKSVMFIDKLDYMEWPQSNGHDYNLAWGFEGNLFENIKDNKTLRELVRFSSFSQNGETCYIGPLGERVRVQLSNGESTIAQAILPCDNQFIGSNSKLDNSATQGPKSAFKTVNKSVEVLTLLCEVLDSQNVPLNINGNCLATYKAYEVYKTLLTDEKARDNGIKYPAHKIFFDRGGMVRVKGACHVVNMYATDESGNKIDTLAVLPPRECKHLGMEEDVKKFTFLSEGREMKKYTLNYDGREFECWGIYSKIYEDAHHSGVYSLVDKAQNTNYYGGIAEVYRSNGLKGLKSYYQNKLDSVKINHALNTCKYNLVEVEEVDIDDFDL